jgi:hypothetical protein
MTARIVLTNGGSRALNDVPCEWQLNAVAP